MPSSEWRGLTAESKAFCGYETKAAGAKARWWLAYLFDAAPKFWWFTLRDRVRFAYARWLQKSPANQIKETP